MDIGTPVLHVDTEENEYVGQIVGRDHEMRPVWRSKEGKVLRNPDGTLADKQRVKTDVMKTEKVDTGLFNVVGFYRDGTSKFLVVAPEDLQEVPPFNTVPVFSHAPADEDTGIAGGLGAAPPADVPTAPDAAAVANTMTQLVGAVDMNALAAAVVAAMKAQGA